MAVNLETNVIIGGRTTSGFDALGNKLTQMGAIIDGISSKAGEFLGESVEVYKDYETLMLEAEGALTTQYESATERAKVMEVLEQKTSEWAANSIFHTDDMAKAVSEAAHAGWDLDEMLRGIPVAMNLAQAGNISLSEGLDDLIKTLNATGMGTEYATTLVDQWTYAANSSATTVGELGEAMKAMGATAQFGGTTEELFTMLAVLADTGTVGSKAGTLLRNAMLRLVAPTKKAADTMAGLELTEEELSELATDSETLEKANALLEEQGFSAYDANGKLKPFLTTFKELDKALEGMTEEDKNSVLSAIFPQRSITGAMALLEAASKDYDGLLGKLEQSEGYAARIAKIQTSGLMGSTEKLLSKEEELKRRVGSLLADPLETAQGTLGQIIDSLNGLDDGALSALTGAIAGIAAEGPALVTAGLGIKVISMIGSAPVVGGLLAAGAAVGAIAGYVYQMNELEFDSTFGNMAINLEALSASMAELTTPGDADRSELQAWTEQVNEAAEAYAGLAQSFAEELKLDTLTNKVLEQGDIDKLNQLGEDMQAQVVAGIQNASSRDALSLNQLFGLYSQADHDNLDPETQALYDRLAEHGESFYGGLEAEAYQIGENIRRQLTAALQNGELTPEDEAAIKAQVERYNQIMAEIAAAQHEQDMAAELRKAQRVSFDSYAEYLSGLDEKYAQERETRELNWDQRQAALDVQYRGDEKNPDYIKASEMLAEQRRADVAAVDDYFGQLVTTAAESLVRDSEWGDYWDYIQGQRAAGNITFDENGRPNYEGADLSGLTTDELRAYIRTAGKMDQHGGRILKPLEGFEGYAGVGEFEALLKDRDDELALMMQAELDRRTALEEQSPGRVDEYGERQAIDNAPAGDLDSALQKVNELSVSLEKAGGAMADLDLANQLLEARNRAVELGATESQFPDISSWQIFEQRYPQGAPTQEGQEVSVGVSGGTEALADELSAMEGQASGASITAPMGVSGGTEAMASELSSMQSEANRGVTVPVRTSGGGLPARMSTFAEGGRATEPSILGEAGPEWAIPEEHSERTAELLDAARQASGFSWSELLSRNGGLNGDANNVVVNTTYAPTINAGDSEGVEAALAADKERVEQVVRQAVQAALREQRFRDAIEVYA